MKEVWKDIVGYEGLYQISNTGKVKSLSFGARNIRESHIVKLLKQTPSNCGYYKVELYNNHKSKVCYVHRLVASHFIPNPDNKSEVNHIDGNKANNVVTNLEWATRSENQLHAIAHNLRASSPMTGRKGKLCHVSKPVKQYDLNHNLIKVWDSQTEAAHYYNVKPCSISSAVNGINKSCKGFLWEA